jgi:regulator of nucleoside diphosphate kinase
MTQRNVSKPAPRPRIVISARDHARLLALAENAARGSSAVAEYLSEELTRAEVVADDDFSNHVAQMGSMVTYRDDTTGRTRTVQLVYPADANIDQQRISILTPIGAALIGLRPAQSIAWPSPGGGFGSLTVLDVRNEDAPPGV